jgi:hypothetical protein
MDKEELKKLAADPNHITGIYNYCDRWCERCSFTARCLNYMLKDSVEVIRWYQHQIYVKL